MAATLVLHSGAKPISRDELTAYKAPEPRGRWFPLSHSRVLSVVSETLQEAGYSIDREQLGIMRDGSRFFGTLDLRTTVTDGVSLAVGIRNSVDQSFPLGFCAGSRTFVCDNLAFSAELLVRRKHTLHGERDFLRRINEAVAGLGSFREQEEGRIDRLKAMPLEADRADALILRAYEKGIIGHRELSKVLREWREPGYDDFKAQTGWSLYNAVTSALRDRAVKMPHSFAVATMRLHGLIEPSRN